MPLPLPNLDTRRWTDLVEEGKALIPRYAPTWTDHNVHDPGITLLELLAWLVEQEIYRANRVPEAHIRKLLALAGFPVLAPHPAAVALSFSAAAPAPVELPAGFTVAASGASEGSSLRFRLDEPLTVLPTTVRAVQTFDGAHYTDQTRTWHSGLPFLAWGDDAAAGASGADASPALYIGLGTAPMTGASLSLWLTFGGRHSLPTKRERIVEEARQQAEYCRPVRPVPCEPDAAEEPESDPASAAMVHHGAACVWEYFDGSGWAPLGVRDETRCLTLDGPVVVTVPNDLQALAVGIVESSLAYIRCRISEGRPDEAPVLRALQVNAGLAVQSYDARSVFEILPGTVVPAGQEPVPGQVQRVRLAFDALGRVTSVAVPQDESWPEITVFDYVPATPTAPGSLSCTLVFAGVATGLPGLVPRLPEAPLANGDCRVWVLGAAGPEEWQPVRDLDAAGFADRVFVLDPVTGVLRFGDGERGRMPPRDAAILARYAATATYAGNVAAGSRWHVLDADDDWNEAVLGGGLGPTAAQLGLITNPLPAAFGALDNSAAAAGRAAERLWSHERLLELLVPGEVTLDQLPRERVLGRAAPPRATTLLDYERLALNVPGTAVTRARAWSGVDAHYPCLHAPGCVSVVIVPALPKARPEPTAGLLEAVHRYLYRRRTLGTRLVAVGPEYVTVRVKARVRTRLRADANRTRADVITAIDRFLDPMTGGPDGRGWPFGRDVYRSEVLQVIDNVPGVDYVESLELFTDDDEVPCGNVCVGLRSLVTPGEHELEVL